MHEANLMRELMTGPAAKRELVLSQALMEGKLARRAIWTEGSGAVADMLAHLREARP